MIWVLLVLVLVPIAWLVGKYGLNRLLVKASYALTPDDVKRAISAVVDSSEFWREETLRLSQEFSFGGEQRDFTDVLVDSYSEARLRLLLQGAETEGKVVPADFHEAIDIEEPGYRRLSPTLWDSVSDIEYVRLDAVRASRYYSLHDPLLHRAVWLVIRYVWGRGVLGPKAADSLVQQLLDTFDEDSDNDLVARITGQWELSQCLIEDGELFLVLFVDKLTGQSRISYVLPEEIQQVILDPNDRRKRVYYKRVHSTSVFSFSAGQYLNAGLKTDYWADWGCEELVPTSEAKFYECARCGVEVTALTACCTGCEGELFEAYEDGIGIRIKKKTGTEHATVGSPILGSYMHQYKTNSRGIRGMPAFFAAIPYVKAYKGFIQDRIVLLVALATFAFKSKIKGNSRAVRRIIGDWGNKVLSRWGGADTVRTAAGQERVPGAGIITENEAMSTEQFRVDTGANNAYLDGRVQRQQVAAAVDVTEANLTGDATVGNLASMTAMNGPQLKGFEWWQTLLKQILTDVYTVVIRAAVVYGKLSPVTMNFETGKTGRRDLSFEIDFPPIVSKDLPTYIGAVAQLISAQSLSSKTYLSPQRIARYILQAFGEENIDTAMQEIEELGLSGSPTDDGIGIDMDALPDSTADTMDLLKGKIEEALSLVGVE